MNTSAKFGLGMKEAHHLHLFESRIYGMRWSLKRRSPNARVGRSDSLLAEKVPLAEQGDYRFLPCLEVSDDLDLAPQNVEDGVWRRLPARK